MTFLPYIAVLGLLLVAWAYERIQTAEHQKQSDFNEHTTQALALNNRQENQK